MKVARFFPCWPRPTLFTVVIMLGVNGQWVREDWDYFSRRYDAWLDAAYGDKMVGPEDHIVALSVFHKFYFDEWAISHKRDTLYDLFPKKWHYVIKTKKEIDLLLKVQDALWEDQEEEIVLDSSISFLFSEDSEDSFEPARILLNLEELPPKKRKINDVLT